MLETPVFQDPPTSGKDWASVAATLRTRPGKWALIMERAPASIPNAIRGDRITALRKNTGIEITTSNNTRQDGRRISDVYLRYNPNKDDGLTGHARRSAIASYEENING